VPEWVTALSWTVRYKNLDWATLRGQDFDSLDGGDSELQYNLSDLIVPVAETGNHVHRWR